MLYLFVAPSGAGKSSIINGLFSKEEQILSVTTRPKRDGEVDGVDYYFISEEEYNTYLENGDLVQKAEYGGNKYGVTKQEFNKLKKGDCAIAVEINSYFTYKKLYPECYGIFLDISKEEQEKRLRKRGDSEEMILKRLSLYEEDIKNKEYFLSGDNSVVDVSEGSLDKNINKVKDILKDNNVKYVIGDNEITFGVYGDGGVHIGYKTSDGYFSVLDDLDMSGVRDKRVKTVLLDSEEKGLVTTLKELGVIDDLVGYYEGTRFEVYNLTDGYYKKRVNIIRRFEKNAGKSLSDVFDEYLEAILG